MKSAGNTFSNNSTSSPLGNARYASSISDVGKNLASILRAKDNVKPDCRPGVATLYVQVTRLDAIPPLEVMNQRLVGRLDWESGNAGFDCLIDLTEGGIWTVGGCDAIGLHAQVRGITTEEPGSVGLGTSYFKYKVSAIVHWGTSVSPKPARFTTTTQILLGAAVAPPTSAVLAVPTRASSMYLLSNTPSEIANMTVTFFQDAAGTFPIYSVVGPSIDVPVPVVQGAAFFSVTYGGLLDPVRFAPVWNLHL